MAGEGPLTCASCEGRHPATERFCPTCGMPLIHVERTTSPSDRQERARKVKRQYSDGRLIRVGSARHQAEAEMLSQMLLDEGVASVIRRSGGFDVPDFLAAGPRDIMVAESGVEVARDVLRQIEPPHGCPVAATERDAAPLWVQALAVTMITVVLCATAAGVMLAVFS